MRTQGTLVKWNDDRGFGFARTRESGVEVFVHISEFPRSGRRPQMGDPLSFEIRTGHDGRKQGHAITWDVPLPPTDFMRPPPPASPRAPATRSAPARMRTHARDRALTSRASRSAMPAIVVLAAVSALGWYFGRSDVPPAAPDAMSAPALSPVSARSIVDPQPAFRCDGRSRCPEMSSCEEAKWFLHHCAGTLSDGDGDGIPCEDQWCGH
ncbi:MAG: cold shock domain-containing protein [Lysobacteraceae bacterium]